MLHVNMSCILSWPPRHQNPPWLTPLLGSFLAYLYHDPPWLTPLLGSFLASRYHDPPDLLPCLAPSLPPVIMIPLTHFPAWLLPCIPLSWSPLTHSPAWLLPCLPVSWSPLTDFPAWLLPLHPLLLHGSWNILHMLVQLYTRSCWVQGVTIEPQFLEWSKAISLISLLLFICPLQFLHLFIYLVLTTAIPS